MIARTKAKITAIGEIQVITSKRDGKQYNKQTIVFQEDGEPSWRQLAITAFGDQCALVAGLRINDVCDIEFEIGSREWNGKYFTELGLKTLETIPAEYQEPYRGEQAQQPQQPEKSIKQQVMEKAAQQPAYSDDLPF